MRRKILYSILNEWRDEDMDDSPIDLDDDMDIEHNSSDMDNEPNLDDDFALSTSNTKHCARFQRTCIIRRCILSKRNSKTIISGSVILT